jgi:hypothetical protein
MCELQPSQRTFDSTLPIPLALLGHSDNVFSKYRACGICTPIQASPGL